jgi:hypothetical protein
VESLAGLVPDPWCIEEFLRRLGEQRGRRIVLRAFQAAGGAEPCGVYAATDTEDHILYPQQANPLQREHVILHEISHMLYDAPSGPDNQETRGRMDPEYARLLFPDIPVHLVRQFLGRTGYSTEVEREAEGFADEFRHVIDQQRQRAATDGMTPAQRAIAERLGAALQQPFGSDLG